MFLSDASVKRPIAMSCLIIGLMLLGLNAYRKVGIELMPKVDIPYITIVSVYPGASPEENELPRSKLRGIVKEKIFYFDAASCGELTLKVIKTDISKRINKDPIGLSCLFYDSFYVSPGFKPYIASL